MNNKNTQAALSPQSASGSGSDIEDREATAPVAQLQAPQLAANNVSRNRLLQRIATDHSTGGTTTLVVGPAGYGKSTLLSQYKQQLDNANWQTAWVSLEDSYSQEDDFYIHLYEAINGFNSAPLLEDSQAPQLADQITAGLIELSHQQQLYAIFIDDYHLIYEESIHSYLKHLLSHLPGNVAMFISSRELIPIPLAKLRTREKLITIGIDELRLDRQEAKLLFEDINKLSIASAQLEQLYQRTDGWAAAMQLAAISYREAHNPESFVEHFSGSVGSVADYLVEEVIDSASPEFTDFLLRASILERINPALCTATTGNSQLSQQLHQLQEGFPLIQQLGDSGQWFRLHPLFRDCLLKRIDTQMPQQKLQAHCAASQWFEEQGMIAEAAQHAINAGDEDRALALLEERGMSLVVHGHLKSLLNLLQRLPVSLQQSSLEIMIQMGWLEALNNHTEQARTICNEIKHIMAENAVSADSEWFKVHELDAALYIFEDNITEGAQLAAQWIDKVPDTSRYAATFSILLAYAELSVGALREAQDKCRWILTSENVIDKSYSYSYATCIHGLAYYYTAQPKRALLHANNSIELLDKQLGQSSLTLTPLKAIAAASHVLLGELEQANALFSEEVLSLDEMGTPDSLLAVIPARAAVLNHYQGLQTAMDFLLEAKCFASEHRNGERLEACILHERLRLLLNRGYREQAHAVFAQELPRFTNSATPFEHPQQVEEYLQLAKIRLALASGELTEADTLLGSLQNHQREQKVLRRIELNLLKARLQAETGDNAAAQQTLLATLLLDQEACILQPYREEGPLIASCLRQLLKALGEGGNALQHQLVTAILESPTASTEATSLAPASAPDLAPAPSQEIAAERETLTEELTKRELATMEKIAAGYSNKEIAEHFHVSINTVKSHITASYSKLGATRRTQAVLRMKELGLVGH